MEVWSNQAAAEGAAAPAEGAEEKKEPENLGDREELWAHKWTFDELETIKAEAFYRSATCAWLACACLGDCCTATSF